MSYTIPQDQVIDYPPEKLYEYYKGGFEWVDNLHFRRRPEEFLSNAKEYVAVAGKIFTEMGWRGDGKISLIWLPPFMFDGVRSERFNNGIVVWFVKQESDGISWILSPIDLNSCEKQTIIFKDDEQRIKKLGNKIAKDEGKSVKYVI